MGVPMQQTERNIALAEEALEVIDKIRKEYGHVAYIEDMLDETEDLIKDDLMVMRGT